MSFWDIIYNLFIGPLELFFEVVYVMAYRVINNPGWSIVILSLAINFLVLPLYRRADIIQKEEAAKEAEMQNWVTRIKKTFKGDERFMMLQTYYRQNNYKPTDVLKGAVPLLLQIPFFMAAYNFLSNLELLKDFKFGPFVNLGAPDGLLIISGIAINVLPILMTIINFISSAIYTKDMPLKSKWQLYLIAILFLALLYNSPSGLVFYWTLNNLFSLAKNIFYKIRNPRFVIYIIFAITSAFFLYYITFVNRMDSLRKQVWMTVLLFMLLLPLLFYFASKKIKFNLKISVIADDKSFYLGCIFVALFIGLLIPTSVLVSSPSEFVDAHNYINPLLYVLSSTLLAIGAFVVWFNVFYMLGNSNGKAMMGYIVFALSGVIIANFALFGNELGNLSSMLQFTEMPIFSVKEQLINAMVSFLIIAVLFVIWKRNKSIVRVLLVATIVSVVALSIVNISKIQVGVNLALEKKEDAINDDATLSLSRDGKNVVIICLDRAIGGYVPYIFEEMPELSEQFSGFTYYPNTVSFGQFTNTATPAWLGGYEYTPEAINKRSEESLESKHNEALKVLPVMFGREGYEVTVCDPPYAGYDSVPDLSIYDEYSYVSAYNTKGAFSWDTIGINRTGTSILYRNFFCFSVFRIAPTFMQSILYNSGMYNNANTIAVLQNVSSVTSEDQAEQQIPQIRDGLTKSVGYDSAFLDNYVVLCNMIDMTEITDNEVGSFLIFQNATTHDPMLLQEPDYSVSSIVENEDNSLLKVNSNGEVLTFSTDQQIIHYQTNATSFIQIGLWLDYLKEEGVYDNTRIIIVSDHGCGLGQFGTTVIDDDELDYMYFNPVLMVKDFNSDEFTIDDEFMTNADVPALAIDGLVKDNSNPFTGNEIVLDANNKSEVHVFRSWDWQIEENNGNTFKSALWATVRDNIFDSFNWSSYAYNEN